MEEIGACERASALLPYPAPELLALGYAELAARRRREHCKSLKRLLSACRLGVSARPTNVSSSAWHGGGRWL
jgi:hypothetical protein